MSEKITNSNHEYNVSIIIPVYNTKKYLNKCLDSVINQTLKNIEIICVDDGSTDGSIDVLNYFKELDDRVVLLNQNHKHAACARNLGLSKAKGKYVVFWDSDDYFKPKALEEMYNQIESDGADICVCGGRCYFEDDGFESPWPSYLKTDNIITKPFSIKTEPDNIISFTNTAIWNKMFKKDFLIERGVLFPDVKNIEDIFFTNCNLCLANSVTYVDKQLVVYRRNTPNGAVSQLSTQGTEVIDLWLETAKFLKKNNIFPERSFSNKCLGGIMYMLDNHEQWNSFEKTFLYLQKNLDRLHIVQKYDGYYQNKKFNTIVERLYTNSSEEFVIWLKKQYYLKNSKSSAKLRNHNEKNRRAIKRIEAEKELLNIEIEKNKKKHKKKIKKIKYELQETSDELLRVKDELSITNKELNKIKSSFSYRLISILLFIPRKTIEIFNRKNQF